MSGIFEVFLEIITKELVEKKDVKLVNFGIFKVMKKMQELEEIQEQKKKL